jgi:hypothetical protein
MSGLLSIVGLARISGASSSALVKHSKWACYSCILLLHIVQLT